MLIAKPVAGLTKPIILLLISEKSGWGGGMHDTQADRAQYSDWLLLKKLGFLKQQ